MHEIVKPFTLNVPDADLQDLRSRIERTRWPERETVADWSQGVPLEKLRDLVGYWQSQYDWRRCERMLNDFGQYKTQIDGLEIYFLHIRSLVPNALPLIMTHGWPGGVLEFHKVIGPLTDPARYGGNPRDAFDLVLPALPGYGLSGKPASPGWRLDRIARAWTTLMRHLGYDHFVAQGGDWGAGVTTALGVLEPEGLKGIHLNAIHLNLPLIASTQGRKVDEDEAVALAQMTEFERSESGYAKLQATRPQTIGYALADSPVGQAAWIYEKFSSWTDSGGNPESVFTRDEMLDIITLYWLTNTGASSARLYWEGQEELFSQRYVKVPVGYTIFPGEIIRAPRRWADQSYSHIMYWNEVRRGGHFAALEQPELFCDELRKCFRQLR